MPKAKIICTSGPATKPAGVLRNMMRSGMDVVRLNFSHATPAQCLDLIRAIRNLNQTHRRHIRILGDLEGFRIRIGKLKDARPIEVKKKQVVWLTQEDVQGKDNLIPFDYRGSLDPVKKGRLIYIDDGTICLKVEARQGKRLKTRVVVPGSIKERKGINMPEVRLHFSGLSAQDKEEIRFCGEQRLDYIAQSFVRSSRDILEIRRYMNGLKHSCKLIAKIENREGIKNIDEIIAVSDGIMIARGDMGISIPIYQVPMVQKQIIRKCNRAGKFVITATQMLESMTDSLTPTRAEVSDVANAVLDGSDFLMLSAETAVGKYPAQCVAMMNRIISFTEKNRDVHPRSNLLQH